MITAYFQCRAFQVCQCRSGTSWRPRRVAVRFNAWFDKPMHPFHFHSFWLTMALSPLGLWLIAMIVGFTSQTAPPKRIGSEVQYVKPVQWSIFSLLMSAGFVWGAALANPASDWPIYLFCGIGIWLFMLVGKPQNVRIDLDANTYCITSGWPYFRKCWQGPLQDVSRIIVTYTGGRAVVFVYWKRMKRWTAQPPALRLGVFSTRRQAEAAAISVIEQWEINVPMSGFGTRPQWPGRK